MIGRRTASSLAVLALGATTLLTLPAEAALPPGATASFSVGPCVIRQGVAYPTIDYDVTWAGAHDLSANTTLITRFTDGTEGRYVHRGNAQNVTMFLDANDVETLRLNPCVQPTTPTATPTVTTTPTPSPTPTSTALPDADALRIRPLLEAPRLRILTVPDAPGPTSYEFSYLPRPGTESRIFVDRTFNGGTTWEPIPIAPYTRVGQADPGDRVQYRVSLQLGGDEGTVFVYSNILEIPGGPTPTPTATGTSPSPTPTATTSPTPTGSASPTAGGTTNITINPSATVTASPTATTQVTETRTINNQTEVVVGPGQPVRESIGGLANTGE